MGKQQGICGNPLYLLLNFAVNLQMQKSVSACLLQSLSAILLPNCPHHRKGSLTVSRVPSLPLGCRALSAQKPPWRQEWAEGQRQAEEAERERQDGAYWAVCGAERRVERGEKGLSEALKPVPPLGSGSQSPET